MFRKTASGLSIIPAVFLSTGLALAQTTPAVVFQNTVFADVPPAGAPASSFFSWIQIARIVGLAIPAAVGPCPSSTAGNPPIVQPPGSVTPGQVVCPFFGPDTLVTRAEMAYWIIRSQVDEPQVANYLCATGGDPSGMSQCGGGIPASSVGDLGVAGAAIVNPFVPPTPALGIAGVTNAQLMRYIEIMIRRGYSKGCGSTDDPVRRFCPNSPVTRAEMSVFIIRAKMNNVFPTTLSGIPLNVPYGDNFGTVPAPYFTDVLPNDPIYGQFYIYIQKMRELGITRGTTATTYSPGDNVTRKEIATFIVRAFFL